VIFREFDGLGLGIKYHDAIVPALSPRDAAGRANFDDGRAFDLLF
jgi:hypothetical protein